MEEKTYRVVISGQEGCAAKVQARFRKYFRRRAASVASDGNGHLDVRLRNGTRISYSEKPPGPFYGEPIVEMTLKATDSYLRRSIEAVHDYAARCDLGIKIEAREEQPKKRTS